MPLPASAQITMISLLSILLSCSSSALRLPSWYRIGDEILSLEKYVVWKILVNSSPKILVYASKAGAGSASVPFSQALTRFLLYFSPQISNSFSANSSPEIFPLVRLYNFRAVAEERRFLNASPCSLDKQVRFLSFFVEELIQVSSFLVLLTVL